MDVKRGEIDLELRRGAKRDAGHAQALSGFHIRRGVINIDGFFGAGFRGAESLAVDERIGLACADRAGVDASRCGKMI